MTADADDDVFNLDLQILRLDTWDIHRECDRLVCLIEMVVRLKRSNRKRQRGAEAWPKEVFKEGIAIADVFPDVPGICAPMFAN